MVNFFFADNTVLVSFALIGRIDLLERLFNTKGTWCPTVKDECQESAKEPGLESLAEVEDFLGDPVYPTKDELEQTQQIRSSLAKPHEHKYKHLGEAETLAVMMNRYAFEILVTDDRDAARLAAQNNIRVVTTWGLLKLVVRLNLAQPGEVLEYLRILKTRGAPTVRGVGDLLAWANC